MMLNLKVCQTCITSYLLKSIKLQYMSSIVSNSNVTHISEHTSQIAKKLNLNDEKLAYIINNHQEKLRLYPVSRWVEIFDYLSQYDFKKPDLLDMVNSQPDLMNVNRSELHECMFAWTNCHFDDKKLRQLLVNQPSCLLLNRKQILSRIPKLLPYVGNKHNRLLELLSYSPNIMFDNWKQIEDKLNYLLFNMELGPSQFVTTHVMSESFFDLKCRHNFLLRLGLWKHRDPKDNANHVTGNPSLMKIIETSDSDFAVKVAKVSFEEFIVFKQLYQKELKDNQNYIQSDDEEE
ncbi:uncharacterized protein LOC126909789 isoform X2 [Daktulosphaira vitifoliae]|uniref:uncharacterized protein LOC126896044 isoform X2 n=1 Tax=Daktulosphaira vitifoliae TaxID=58002 RepID=UPI0021AA36C9|nr:uncharacterized protein LOC126896044 isoform X2 [Daktulosphaira vitifoliae]XP_050548173.1 uncharacterized protein LOC126909789 isoform X2 [Daktulosphaira vitifoliae]